MLAMLWDEFLYVDLADHVLSGCVAPWLSGVSVSSEATILTCIQGLR